VVFFFLFFRGQAAPRFKGGKTRSFLFVFSKRALFGPFVDQYLCGPDLFRSALFSENAQVTKKNISYRGLLKVASRRVFLFGGGFWGKMGKAQRHVTGQERHGFVFGFRPGANLGQGRYRLFGEKEKKFFCRLFGREKRFFCSLGNQKNR